MPLTLDLKLLAIIDNVIIDIAGMKGGDANIKHDNLKKAMDARNHIRQAANIVNELSTVYGYSFDEEEI
jgi:hypothetical protein